MTTRVKSKDANRDPLTGEPGAHPVGTGIGAVVGGAAAGAAAGTVAGPVGTAVGAAMGASVGGLAGKAAAEKIDPTVEVLRRCADETARDKDRTTHERLVAMRDFFETMSTWYEQIDQLPTPAVIKFVKMGSKVAKWIGFQ